VRRHGSLAVHLFPAGLRLRMLTGLRRADLRAGAHRHVCPGRRKRLRPQLQRPSDGADKVTYGDVFLQAEQEYSRTISSMPTPKCCSAISRMPKASAARSWKPVRRDGKRRRAPTPSCCRPMTSASRQPHLQPAGCARRDLRHRTAELYPTSLGLRCANWPRPAAQPGAVRGLNVVVESFPSNLVAQQFKFEKAEYFEIEDEADKTVPTVGF
jgi:hypothetical protein